MVLVSYLNGSDLVLGSAESFEGISSAQTSTRSVPSETYLQEIEAFVASPAVGGWSHVTDWCVRTTGDSFTSLRGFVTLVNTLASVHGLSVHLLDDAGDIDEKSVSMPLEPKYASEPNITIKK